MMATICSVLGVFAGVADRKRNDFNNVYIRFLIGHGQR